jgi:hypothetical protein
MRVAARVRGKEVGAEKRLVSNEFYLLLVLYLVSTTTTLLVRGPVLARGGKGESRARATALALDWVTVTRDRRG